MKSKKKFLIIILIIIVVLILLGIFKLVSFKKEIVSKNEKYKNRYTIEEVNKLYNSTLNEYNSNEIDANNIEYFSILLNYLDGEIGKNNYYISSLYISEVGDHKAYVIKIVPKKYVDEYKKYEGANNPYEALLSLPDYWIKKNTFLKSIMGNCFYERYIHDGYANLVVGLKYEEKIKDYFKNSFNHSNYKFKVEVDYNPYFAWKDATSVDEEPSVSVNGFYDATTITITTYGKVSDLKDDLKNSKRDLRKLGIQSVDICGGKDCIDKDYLKTTN